MEQRFNIDEPFYKNDPESYAYYNPYDWGETPGFTLEQLEQLSSVELNDIMENDVAWQEKVKNITKAILEYYDRDTEAQ